MQKSLSSRIRTKDGLLKPVAWVVLKAGFIGNAEMVTTLLEFVVSRLPNYKRPRRVEFVSELPKTASGKIQRFKLRQASPNFRSRLDAAPGQ